jgi:hypothetical protein
MVVIHHRTHTIETVAVKVKLFQPVFGVG